MKVGGEMDGKEKTMWKKNKYVLKVDLILVKIGRSALSRRKK